MVVLVQFSCCVCMLIIKLQTANLQNSLCSSVLLYALSPRSRFAELLPFCHSCRCLVFSTTATAATIIETLYSRDESGAITEDQQQKAEGSRISGNISRTSSCLAAVRRLSVSAVRRTQTASILSLLYFSYILISPFLQPAVFFFPFPFLFLFFIST